VIGVLRSSRLKVELTDGRQLSLTNGDPKRSTNVLDSFTVSSCIGQV
jgi:hypothetical protein